MSSSFQLLTDSTCDLPLGWYQEHQVDFIPFEFTLENRTMEDDAGQTMSAHEFYDIVRGGAMPTTNMVNLDRYCSFFSPYLEAGKDVYYICFSSGLSGSFDSAQMAAKELREKYPERKIFVTDSTCASMGFGLLMHYTVKKRDEGLSLDELYAWVEENKSHINHLFTVDNLMHLHRGGRVSKASAILGTMVGIKPMLNVSIDGKLIPCEKLRGRKAALNRLASWMEQCTDQKKFDMVMISHGDAPEEAELVRNLVRDRFEVEEFFINPIGPVIGAHSGPGTIALFFWGKDRVPSK